jgi:hypothetical protein
MRKYDYQRWATQKWSKILRFAQNDTKRVLLVMLSGAKHLWLLFLLSLEK